MECLCFARFLSPAYQIQVSPLVASHLSNHPCTHPSHDASRLIQLRQYHLPLQPPTTPDIKNIPSTKNREYPPVTSSAPPFSQRCSPHLPFQPSSPQHVLHIHSPYKPLNLHLSHRTTPPPLPLSTVSYPSPPQTPLLRHPLPLTESEYI